ncbi:DUF1064 domain-containing protein [Paenibacillus tundrae]
MRGNKYGAKKTVKDGITFASKMESERYRMLMLLERAGEISELTLQPVFQLVDPFTKMGKKKRGIKYTADFMYKQDGQSIVEDVKGFAARDFSLRRTLFDAKYPDIVLKLVTKTGGRWEER